MIPVGSFIQSGTDTMIADGGRGLNGRFGGISTFNARNGLSLLSCDGLRRDGRWMKIYAAEPRRRSYWNDATIGNLSGSAKWEIQPPMTQLIGEMVRFILYWHRHRHSASWMPSCWRQCQCRCQCQSYCQCQCQCQCHNHNNDKNHHTNTNELSNY